MSKRIAIIGRGTAGCYAVSFFLKRTDFDIDWYFDPNIKPQAVGEGSTLEFPYNLYKFLNFNVDELESIFGTPKLGIKKFNWGLGNNFTHVFPGGYHGIHFTATKLQEWILEHVKHNRRLRIYEQNVTNHDKLDADFVYDCSGKPSNYDDYHLSQYIPVNSVHVNQCFWDGVKFNYTLCIARPYGWVFGIPLLNRCSIGYMYNNNITSLDAIKEDIQTVFVDFNLTPSDQTNSFSFKNYYKKRNFIGRSAFSGNASFFLEPLEATSIQCMSNNQILAYDYFMGRASIKEVNTQYHDMMKSVENIIMLHYAAGSIFNNEFWSHAKDLGRKNYATLLTNPSFLKILYDPDTREEYGGWSHSSIKQNLMGLDLVKY